MRTYRWSVGARIFPPLLGALLLVAIFLSPAYSAAPTYTVIDLATLSQGTPSVVRGPNGAGVAVGGGTVVGSASGPRRGLLFQSGTSARQIAGLPGSDDTTVYGLNDAGAVVGSSNTTTGVRAFAGTSAGTTRELPPLPGDTASIAYAVNNLGQAVGLSSGPSGERAVRWDANGSPAALPVFPAMIGSRASAINVRGDVVGVMRTTAARRPVAWPIGLQPRELMLLAGHVSGETFAVNTRGDAVGYSANVLGARRATSWPFAGGVVDLGTLPGGSFSQAFQGNDAGEIVGASNSSAGDRAFLWTLTGGMQDLNTLIPPSPFVLTKAVGINNVGMIIATGHDVTAGQTTRVTAEHAHDEAHELPIRVFLLIRAGGVQ
jgi:probable HAF family extracellular repeat protein